MVFDYNSYVKVVILGNLCGGGFQDSPRTRFLWWIKRLVWMAGAHIFREKGLSGWLGRVFLEKRGSSGWLGRVFLEKKACLDGWGAYFSRKRLVWMAGARISREKACLAGCGAYFSRKRLAWMAAGDLSEIQEISPEFSFMVFDYNSYVKVVILGNLCGGAFRTPQGGVFRGG